MPQIIVNKIKLLALDPNDHVEVLPMVLQKVMIVHSNVLHGSSIVSITISQIIFLKYVEKKRTCDSAYALIAQTS